MTKRRPWWSDRLPRLARHLVWLAGCACLASAQASPALLDALLQDEPPELKRGLASFYSNRFHGRRTASGEIYNRHALTAASNHFPLGSWVAIRHPASQRCAIVRINDRMHGRHTRRVVDLSQAAAARLGVLRLGVANIEMAALDAGSPAHDEAVCRQAFAQADRGLIDKLIPPEAANVSVGD